MNFNDLICQQYSPELNGDSLLFLTPHIFHYAYQKARNQLGTPGGEEFSERDPNFLNYVQQI